MTSERGVADQKKFDLSVIIVSKGGMISGKTDGIRKDLMVKDFTMVMSLGFIAKEKEIVVFKNLQRENMI